MMAPDGHSSRPFVAPQAALIAPGETCGSLNGGFAVTTGGGLRGVLPAAPAVRRRLRRTSQGWRSVRRGSQRPAAPHSRSLRRRDL